MDNFYKIKETNEKLFQMLNDFSAKGKVEIVETKTKDLTIKYQGKLLHSAYNPYKEAEKNMSQYDFKNKDVILVLGLAYAYHIEEIIKKIDKEAKVYIIEHDLEIIKSLLENRDLSKILNKNIIIFHTSQFLEFNYKLEANFKLGISPRYEIVVHKIEFEIFNIDYMKYIELFKNSLSSILVNTTTIFNFAKMWHKNSFKNLKHLKKSIKFKNLIGEFKDIPVIIVSAGPSLDKNIKYLHWIKGKAVIISVGTALKKLLKENIKPDFVITVDGGEANWEHFRRIEYDDITLVYELMVHPQILNYHKGNKVAFTSSNIVADWAERSLGENGFLKMGGSVAITAYDMAVRSGGNPVILIGQDLAYSGGKTHVSGSIYENDKVIKDDDDMHQMYVEDIYGKTVLSDRKFFTFKDYFERFIRTDKENDKNLKVIDATEGGAVIKGTEIMSLKDVYFKYIENKEFKIAEVLLKLKNESFEENFEKIFKSKIEILKKLKNVLKSINVGIDILNKIIKNKNYKRIKELDEIDKLLNKNIEVSNLVRFITQPIISRTIKKAREERSDEEVFIANLELYKGIKDGIEFNIECMEEI